MNRTAAIILGFILAIVVLYGIWELYNITVSQREKTVSPDTDPLVLILKERSDTLSVTTTHQLSTAFDYTQIPFSTEDLALMSDEFNIPESVRLLIITTSAIEEFDDENFEDLLAFVAEGNDLFFTSPVYQPRFNFLQGMKYDSEYVRNDSARGFSFKKMIFPNAQYDSYKLPDPFYHKAMDGRMFEEDIEVLIESADTSKTPILIRKSFNTVGDVYYFNSQTGYDKLNRGILFSTVLRSLEGIPYSVNNISTIFLDDFPAPLYKVKEPPIDWEYDTTHADFVYKIWWPDMKKLADSLNIDYTAMTTFNYNANVVPPFDFDEWTQANVIIDGEEINGSIRLADEIKNSRHELGFHGYNHFSLWQEDWPNQQFMIAALRAARKRWRIDDMGSLPVTYVPPTNIIDSVGIRALTTAMPNIKYLSSLYIGEKPIGAGREFSPDPYDPNLFNYPRISSGFVYDENASFKLHSLYLITGIWTHFVHPDDVYQVIQSREDIFASRNELGLGWHKSRDHDFGLYEVFLSLLDHVMSSYPQIQFMSAKDAVPKVKAWKEQYVSRSLRNGIQTIKIANDSGGESSPGSLASWFMYVDSTNADRMKEELDSRALTVDMVPFWEGYLAQFQTREDSISIYDIYSANRTIRSAEFITEKLDAYLDPEGDDEGVWRDTRLEDALAALQENPDSVSLQEKVIEFALEFDRVELTLPILEKRLLNNAKWQKKDVERLLTYYGYQAAYERAFRFLEKLWGIYKNQSVISLKDKMINRYGAPNEEFRVKWLKRELKLKPDSGEVLWQLVRINQSEETWSQKKKYLLRLIELKPRSDSLYYYTLQRSFYYDKPEERIDLLEQFPQTAYPQLKPLAGEIANTYGYELENYSKALEWASRAPDLNVRSELEWVLQQGKYIEFYEKGLRFLEENPEADSIRVFVGQQMIYEGYYEKGFDVLYPLFQKNSAPSSTQKLVHTEIGYKSYNEKKEFYQEYPAFYSDSLRQDLNTKLRENEGTTGGLAARYASDNFDNELAEFGIFSEWGNRINQYHTVKFDQFFIGSTVNNTSLTDDYFSLEYLYKRNYRGRTMQSTLGGGIYNFGGELNIQSEIGFWFARDSSFTSISVRLDPTTTNSALRQDISQVRGTLYREDLWRNGKIQTTFSSTATWYTDKVFAFEALPRIYLKLPFSSPNWRYRTVTEISYSDATVNHFNAVPYYTPENLFIKGLGIDLRYRDMLQEPSLSIELEAMGKHDNRDGFFFASTGRFNARLSRFWELSLNAHISSSKVYSFNNFGFSLSYKFPKSLNNK